MDEIMGKRVLAFCLADLETTGLDHFDDHITEVAVKGLDADLNEVFSYEAVVELDEAGWARLNANEIPREMARANGLLSDLSDPGVVRKTVEQVESELLAILAEFEPAEARGFVLAGSGCGTHDVPILRRRMPKLMERFAYYPHDTGVIRREWERATGQSISEANLSKTHRAMDDVVCHLEEARAVRRAFKLAGELLYGEKAA